MPPAWSKWTCELRITFTSSTRKPRDRRMGMKQPLYPLRRSALGQILIRELVHGRDKWFDTGDGFERIPVRLALVVTRIGVECRHQQKRQHNGDEHEQRQVGEIGEM